MGKTVCILFLCTTACINAMAVQVPDEDTLAYRYFERAKVLYDRGEYDSVPFYFMYSEGTFNRLGRYELSARCMLGLVDCYRQLKQPSAATLKLDSAERYIEGRLGRGSESWSDALYARAKLYHSENRNPEAIHLLNTWLERHGEAGSNMLKRAWVHEELGVIYYSEGELDSAEVYYRLALSCYREAYPGPSPDIGRLLFNLGLVYSQRNNRRQWAGYTREAILNNIQLFGPDSPKLAGSYGSLASYYIAVARMDSATHYLDLAEPIMKKAFEEDYYGLAIIYFDRARVSRYEGDYNTSLGYFARSLQIQQAQEIPGRNLLNLTFLNIGKLYAAMGDYLTAEDYFSRLLGSEGRVGPNLMAVYYYYLANVEINLGSYGDAENYLKKIMAIRKDDPSADKHSMISDYETYGTLMDSTGRPDRAGEYFDMALELARTSYGDEDYRTAQSYAKTGDHYLHVKDPGRALALYQQAIRCMVPDYDTGRPEINPAADAIRNPMFYLSVLKNKGSALVSLAESAAPEQRELYTRSAFSAYRTSVQLIDLLSTSYPDDQSKLFRSASERSVYEKGVRYAYRSYELTGKKYYLSEAFRIAEKGKYATLQSVLRREDALHMAGIPDSLRVLEAGLKKQLRIYEAMIAEKLQDSLPDTVAIQQFRDEVFRVKDRLAGLRRMLESDYPDYYSLVYGERIPDPEVFAGSLRPGEKIFEYFMAGKELYTFELSRKEFTCRRDSLDGDFMADLERLERYVGGNSVRDSIRDQHMDFIRAAHRVYGKLVPSPDEFRDLIFIPEGELSFLPFEILITEPVRDFNGSFRDLPFLIRSHTVRYGYSTGLLARKDHGHRESLRHFAGFAPGYLAQSENKPGSENPRDIRIDRSSLEALPGSIKEVKEIGKLLGGRVFTGKNASEGEFKKLALQSHILHLATHTFIDDEDPLRSKMVFSDNPEYGEDGMLNVYELYNMDLRAKLVVLSACNTGAGKIIGGEGIMSLSRAFFYAGVPNVLLTLWTVTDQQSYRLMLAFYRNLKRGRPAERSLQKAKLEFLDNAAPQYQHPRYWAGFILAGNPEPLFMPDLFRPALVLAGILILCTIGFIILRKNLRKRRSGG